MLYWFGIDSPKEGGADTETTGLHIKFDTPFLMVYGWIVNENLGRVWVFYPTPQNMKDFAYATERMSKVFFWNTKYDMHMMANGGYPYKFDNLSDGMLYARLVLNSDVKQSLKLKAIAKKYIDSSARLLEDDVKKEFSALKKERNKVLLAMLKPHGKWTMKRLDKIQKDIIAEFPDEVKDVYENWLENYPEPTYVDIDRDLMIKYAGNDVIIMLEFIEIAKPILKNRMQEVVLDREERLIKPLYEMERVGLKVDREYLLRSKKVVKDYIAQKRMSLWKLAGQEMTVGQAVLIMKLLKDKWGIEVISSDQASLQLVMNEHSGDVKEFCELINELRTLEKWYATYILRILKNSERDGRAYTQINQAGAVTGRVSCDFQQFPKDNLYDDEGNVLFEPRRAFTISGGGYNEIYYLDYSQIELRVQADYTYKLVGGDLNLCRAYMPFKCVSTKTKEVFDPSSKVHLARWDSGEWVDEKGVEWTPTDVHGATTHNAFPDLEVGSPEFKKLRGTGKTVNFAKNYGSGMFGIVKAMKGKVVGEGILEALNQGYYKAFPNVIDYQKAVIKKVSQRGYVVNQYGRRYYITSNNWAYKFCNYLVQGSCADMLKEKIIEIYEFLKPYKTKLQMNIHDELSFETWVGEEHLIPKIKAIMEECDWINVPVVADVEVTRTNWAEKEDVA
jgi:DNA polymerase-1